MVNVTVEARNDAGSPGVVKLQGETWELNVWATTDELWKLADIEKTDWAQRRTLQVGTCAHAPVWWNELDGTVHIVVGHDDVTWDAGVTVPLATIHELLTELGEPPEVTPPPFGPTLFLARPSKDRQVISLRYPHMACPSRYPHKIDELRYAHMSRILLKRRRRRVS